ncbi:putative acyl-activating enzyme 1, peroxisomal [Panicum miliaceum]|uniref:4-coumarate--CoA ligase n=1 Tax=Panicum miliaceum TaxID=4540 RepID=A0A3L6TQI0_PANMI|nr:putative acyl-activating enzyme 1, peroxisomal [Panicum miliaceum]
MDGSMWCAANYVPLTPLSFLERAALVYGDRTAVDSGDRQFSWRDARAVPRRSVRARTSRRASRRRPPRRGRGHRLEHTGDVRASVPMTGGVLCTLNSRHDAAMVSVLLKHSDAKVFLVETQFLALRLLAGAGANLPLVITISDTDNSGSDGGSGMDYEALLRSAPRGFEIRWPTDERDPISLNYTSGTTSRPKGVIYSHSGAVLKT